MQHTAGLLLHPQLQSLMGGLAGWLCRVGGKPWRSRVEGSTLQGSAGGPRRKKKKREAG